MLWLALIIGIIIGVILTNLAGYINNLVRIKKSISKKIKEYELTHQHEDKEKSDE